MVEAAAGNAARNGLIVFTHGWNPKASAQIGPIAVMQPENGAGFRILSKLGDATDPVWSPDGRTLAFSSSIGIRFATAEGSLLPQSLAGLREGLCDGGGIWPAWSPDGRHVALVSEPCGGADDLWVGNSAGSGVRRISPARGALRSAHWREPAWSPNGAWIACTLETEIGDSGDWVHNVALISPDGQHVRRLTTDGKSNDPSWSPDGQKIAYRSRANGNSEIWVMNPSGSGKRRLTSGGNHYAPSWSPDGKKIVLVVGRNAHTYDAYRVTGDLAVIDSDGRALTLLTHSGKDAAPNWQSLGAGTRAAGAAASPSALVGASPSGAVACSRGAVPVVLNGRASLCIRRAQFFRRSTGDQALDGA